LTICIPPLEHGNEENKLATYGEDFLTGLTGWTGYKENLNKFKISINGGKPSGFPLSPVLQIRQNPLADWRTLADLLPELSELLGPQRRCGFLTI